MFDIVVTEKMLGQELQTAKNNAETDTFLRDLGVTKKVSPEWLLLEDREAQLLSGAYRLEIVPIPHTLRSDEILLATKEALVPGERIARAILGNVCLRHALCRELRQSAVREAEVFFPGTQWDERDASVVFPSLLLKRAPRTNDWRVDDLSVFMLGKPGERLAHEKVLQSMDPARHYMAVLHHAASD